MKSWHGTLSIRETFTSKPAYCYYFCVQNYDKAFLEGPYLSLGHCVNDLRTLLTQLIEPDEGYQPDFSTMNIAELVECVEEYDWHISLHSKDSLPIAAVLPLILQQWPALSAHEKMAFEEALRKADI